eukprot:Gb_15854 [translate_table: standard]
MPNESSFSWKEIRLVLQMALISRIVVLSLIVIWRGIASPYDTSASLDPPCLSPTTMDPPPPIFSENDEQIGVGHKLGKAIEASVVWDGVYYVRIAQCGYEYEQTYAFLPFLPLCMRLLSKTVFAPLRSVLGYRAVLALSGYVLNNTAFVLAAIYLYKLSILVLKESRAALRTTALFCFNPASIFYSSIYSESLFSLLSFAGIYYLISGVNWKAMLFFAVSSAVRSNGVINAGFFLFQAMHRAYDAFFQQNQILLSLQVLIIACLQSVCVFVPFFLFQLYGFLNICLGGSSSEGSRPWCRANVPYLYGFIQSHYWEVGFLRYFQLKQLPNFLLASPMLLLGTCSIIGYAKHHCRLLFSLGLQASHTEKETAAVFYFLEKERILNKAALLVEDHPDPSTAPPFKRMALRRRTHKYMHGDTQATAGHDLKSNDETTGFQMKQGFFSTLTVPFILQLGFMVAVASFVMHVQVATRFLSVSPPIYWFASHVMESSPIGFKLGYLIWAVFLSYMVFGSLLFSNFYPFT